MAEERSFDAENGLESGKGEKELVTDVTYTDVRVGSVDNEVARTRAIQNGFAPLRFLNQGEQWLDEKMGIETQGIDRIPEEEKRPPSIINTFFLWWSMTMHVGTLPIGILGPTYGLSLGQSAAGIVVGTFLGALCTAYTGTLGPKVSKTLRLASRLVLRLYHSWASAKSLALDIPSAFGVPSYAPSSTFS